MAADSTQLYLNLLKNTLTNLHYKRPLEQPFLPQELQLAQNALALVREQLESKARQGLLPQSREILTLLQLLTPEVAAGWMRRNTWEAHTLLDPSGLDNVEFCLRQILQDQIPGDLIECGTWKGGTCIWMRGILKALGDNTRLVWVADSFQGLPDPDPHISPLDLIAHAILKEIGAFRVSQADVEAHFQLYHLLDSQVRFLPGWFSQTLAQAPLERLSLLRLDADYYDSTQQILEALYPKVSPGGFIIVDDYGNPALGARRATEEYRQNHSISSPVVAVNEAVVYWRKDH